MKNEQFTPGPKFLYKGMSYTTRTELEIAKEGFRKKELLRAAAPDMVGMLQEWVDYLDSDLSEAETILLAKTKQVINKALGI